MVVWNIMLVVVLVVLIGVLSMIFAKVNQSLLFIVTIVMALLLLFIEFALCHKSLYEQQWILPIYIVVTSVVALVLVISLLTNGSKDRISRGKVKIESADNDSSNSRFPKTGHRAPRIGHRASRIGHRKRRK